MKNIILIFGLVMLVNLAYTAPNVAPPTSEQLAKLKSADPSIDTTAVQNGYNVFAEKCQKCHKLKDPAKFTTEDWNKILPKMAKKAKLTDDQTALVKTYVIAFCQKP